MPPPVEFDQVELPLGLDEADALPRGLVAAIASLQRRPRILGRFELHQPGRHRLGDTGISARVERQRQLLEHVSQWVRPTLDQLGGHEREHRIRHAAHLNADV